MESFKRRGHIYLISKVILFCLVFSFLAWLSYSTNENYTYQHTVEFFKISTVEQKIHENVKGRNLILFIGIFTASKYKNRRDAIRKTWMKTCHEDYYSDCKSKFILDGLSVDGKPMNSVISQLQNESRYNNHDMEILQTPVGLNFALRILASLRYAFHKYHFDYFLRMDDDYYPCIHRLMFELPKRMNLDYVFWGFTKCSPIRNDEGFILINHKLAKRILERENSLICTNFGGTAVSKWVLDISKTENISWFADNDRVWHHPPVSFVPELKTKKEICHTYLALHGVYFNDMGVFHKIMLGENKTDYTLNTVKNHCALPKHRIFPLWSRLPDGLCQEIPIFDTSNKGGSPWNGRGNMAGSNFSISQKQ